MIISYIPRSRCLFIMLHEAGTDLSYFSRQMFVYYALWGRRLPPVLCKVDTYLLCSVRRVFIMSVCPSLHEHAFLPFCGSGAHIPSMYPLHMLLYIYISVCSSMWKPFSFSFGFLLYCSTRSRIRTPSLIQSFRPLIRTESEFISSYRMGSTP